MKVQVVRYREVGDYYWDYNNSRIGARGIEATIECGYLTDDVWNRTEFGLDTRVTTVSDDHYIHVVIPEHGLYRLPDENYVALVQQITADVVALTPLHVPSGSALKEWRTTYHQRGE